MADKKISALTGATTPLAGTEVLPIVQNGSTVKVTVSNLTDARNIRTADITAISGGNVGGTGAVVGLGANALNAPMAAIKGSLYNAAAGEDQGALELQTRPIGGAGQVLTTRVLIGSDGNVTVSAGNLVQGTAAKGVNFTANTPAAGMTSQLLNNYEEGTWTPTYVSTGATFGYTQQKGSYVRIGNLVYAQFYLNVTASGTTTNQVTLTGLPFTSTTVNTPYEQGFGSAWSTNTQAVAFTINPGSTDANLWRQNTGPAVATANNVVGYQVGTLIYRAA